MRNSLSIWCTLTMILLGLPSYAATHDEAPAKLPIPDAAAVEKSTKQVEKQFRKTVNGAKSLDARYIAGKKIGEESHKSWDDPVDEYAFRSWCLALPPDFQLTASWDSFLFNVAALESRFDVDGVSIRAEFIRKCGKSTKLIDTKEFIILICDTASLAVESDRYDVAAEVISAAASVSKRLKTIGAKQAIDEAAARIETCKREFDLISTAFESLKKDEANADAASIAGRFRCFVQKSWRIGLPLLAKCADTELARIAAADLENLAAADKQRRVADGWYQYSKTANGPPHEQCQRRALHWYRTAFPALSKDDATSVSERIKEIEQSLPIGAFPWGAFVLFTFEKPTWQIRDNKQFILDVSGEKSHATTKDAKHVDGTIGKPAIMSAGKVPSCRNV